MILEVVITVLVADFASGVVHWLEDAYGRQEWPITGWLITEPNIRHHHDPRYFTRHGWFRSSWLLLCFNVVILAVAWLCGLLTWHVWLFAALGANANEIHKWAHRSLSENGPIISFLQRIRLLQTARHHLDPKNSHYCVLTNFVNPIVDRIGLWARLEAAIRAISGIRRRLDTSVIHQANIKGTAETAAG